INESGTTLGNGEQGAHQEYGKYVSIKGTNDIWDGFAWKNSKSGLAYKNQTFQARGVYHHFNGSRYLSLYDNKGIWLGYINESGTMLSPGAQGNYQKYGKYVTIKSEDYSIWRNFSWTQKASGKFANKTYLAKGVYHHFNGSRYLSLYDAKDNWIGYINEKGTKLGQSQADKFKKVQELLNKEYNSKNFGIYVASLVDGSVAQINSEQQFHAASTGKLPALYYTQKMILDKKVDGNYPYTYTDAINQMPNAYMRGGAGVLQGQPYGKKFSLNTIMNWTAKYSDNQGTNFLAYYAANKYDATMKKEISRIMGRNWTAPFYVNAKDNAMMLEAIYHQGGKLITDLSNTVYDDQRIPKYLPVQVAHKIGDVEDLRHDAGIVYSKNPYTLSILTKNYQSYEQISILSKKIYDILK
ncbi:serine hydrolase, partial [Enterococcus eurekensis]